MTQKQLQKRCLLILGSIALAFVLVMTGVLIWYLRQEKEEEQEESKQILVFDRMPSLVTEIEYDYKGATVHLRQENGLWSLLDPSDPDADRFPLNMNFIYSTSDRSMTAKCAKLVLAKRVMEECTDLSTYGLDSPVLSLRYHILPDSTSEETVLIKVFFGKTYATGQRYCMIEVGEIKDPALYLIDSSYYETFAHEKADLANRDTLPQIEKDCVLSYQLGEQKVTSAAGIQAVFDQLADLDFSEFANYYATKEEFQSYGVYWQEETEPKEYPQTILTICHYATKADREKAEDPETKEEDRPKPYTFYLCIGKTESGKTYYRAYGKTAVYQIEESFFQTLTTLFDTHKEA